MRRPRTEVTANIVLNGSGAAAMIFPDSSSVKQRCSFLIPTRGNVMSASEKLPQAVARIKDSETDLEQHKSLRLIIVVTERDQAPPSAQNFPILRRPNTITDDAEGFIADLAGLLRGIAGETGVARQAEPQRLFEAKEYRAAVISAMTLLEARLRERLNKVPWPQTSRPLPMRSLRSINL
jgi:hypothetical protein